MKTKVLSCCYDGNQSQLICVESGFTRGFTGLHLIGNASDVCRDGKERAKTALENLGIYIPAKKIIINLTPADVKKDSNHFDLPIAISLFLLLRDDHMWRNDPGTYMFAAELGLTGELRPVRGVISFAITAMREGLKGIIVARSNLHELMTLTEIGVIKDQNFKILGFDCLQEVFDWIYLGMGDGISPTPMEEDEITGAAAQPITFNDMFLIPEQKKIAECVATGLHSLLMRGVPGTGKSMLATRLPSILPRMPPSEHLQALLMTSTLAPKIPLALLRGVPPFRSPHHQASTASVLGNTEKPGEVSLAHGGILFLDEVTEFRRDLIEALREPLETGMVHIARANKKVNWHSRATLVAACNTCPCGWNGSSRKVCLCPPQRVQEYQGKLSGPILDRIDIHYTMPESPDPLADLVRQLSEIRNNVDATEEMRTRVLCAREFAMHRNKRYQVKYNCDLKSTDILMASGVDEKTLNLYVNEFIKKSLTARSLVRCLRVARTLADLDESPSIRAEDIRQAFIWSREGHASGAPSTDRSRRTPELSVARRRSSLLTVSSAGD